MPPHLNRNTAGYLAGVARPWSPNGRFLAATADFDDTHYDKALAQGLSALHAEFQSWRFTNKRAVFDFEDRVVALRDGHWTDVSWRPKP